MKARIVSLFLMLGFMVGCHGSEEATETVSYEEPPALIDPDEVPSTAPTVEMVRAALVGDPQQMANAIGVMAACHATTPCGSSYGACTAWSAAINCGTPACGGVCGPLCPSNDPLCERPQALLQPRERYRVCFSSSGAQCTEWQRLSSTALSCFCEE